MAKKRQNVWEKTKGHCHLCSQELDPSDWVMDHVIPKCYEHSSNEEWNLLPACRGCNSMKWGAGPEKLKRILMFGRYCLNEVNIRWHKSPGKDIDELVRKRAGAESDSQRYWLWETTLRKPK